MPHHHSALTVGITFLVALFSAVSTAIAQDAVPPKLPVIINRNGYEGPIYLLPPTGSSGSATMVPAGAPLNLAAGRHTLAIGGTGMHWDISFTIAASGSAGRLEIQPDTVSPVTAATGSRDRIGLQIVPVIIDWGNYRQPIRPGNSATVSYSGRPLHYPLVRGFGLPIFFDGGSDHALVQVDNSGFVAVSRFPRSLDVELLPAGGAHLRVRTRQLIVPRLPKPDGTYPEPPEVKIGSLAVSLAGGTFHVVADYPVHLQATRPVEFRYVD